MLLEWKSCNCTDTTINSQFEALEQSVIQLLSEEIKRPGPVTKRLSMPMQQLIALNRGFYAVDLYLRRQSSVLREGIKELHVSEEPLFYVRQGINLFWFMFHHYFYFPYIKVSTMIVNTILEMCKEFSEQIDYYPLILQWSFRELNVLISLVRRHVLEAAPTMTVLAHTWRILTGKCALLAASGIDLSFEVNRLATPSLQAALDNNFRNIIESHRLRIAVRTYLFYTWTLLTFNVYRTMGDLSI
jgi:hypothetical protein